MSYKLNSLSNVSLYSLWPESFVIYINILLIQYIYMNKLTNTILGIYTLPLFCCDVNIDIKINYYSFTLCLVGKG